MLVLDGAYLVGTEPLVFRRIAPPSAAELQALVERLAERIGRALERQGVLSRDAESSYLDLTAEAGGPMDDLLGHSITYRVAVGPRAGQKVFSLQTVSAREEGPRKEVVRYAGFSLHAGIGVEAEQREKRERLTRYVSRPPVSVERLDLTAQGQVRYRLKTPYRDGTTHIVLEALDFIARLAGAGAAAAGAPDEISRSVRCQRDDARGGHSSRKRSPEAATRRTRATDTQGYSAELGAALEAGVRDRD